MLPAGAAPSIEVTTQRASREIERAYGEVIRTRTRDFIQCEIADIRANRRRGASDVTIKFIVSPEGKVSQANTLLNTANSRSLESCLISTLSQIRFPPPGENQVFVTYPFRFNRTTTSPPVARRTVVRRAPPRRQASLKSKKSKKPPLRRGAKAAARKPKKPTKKKPVASRRPVPAAALRKPASAPPTRPKKKLTPAPPRTPTPRPTK